MNGEQLLLRGLRTRFGIVRAARTPAWDDTLLLRRVAEWAGSPITEGPRGMLLRIQAAAAGAAWGIATGRCPSPVARWIISMQAADLARLMIHIAQRLEQPVQHPVPRMLALRPDAWAGYPGGMPAHMAAESAAMWGSEIR